MATISCVDKKTSRPTERAQHCGIAAMALKFVAQIYVF
jgi:hypothetical protein